MKTIEVGFYERYLGPERRLRIEVLSKTPDDSQPWQADPRLTAVHQYKRKAGKITFRVGQNAPMEADLWQVRYDELPETEWYEYFTAGMSDIHPNDRLSS
jgi:hypothetical protein